VDAVETTAEQIRNLPEALAARIAVSAGGRLLFGWLVR